MHRKSKLMAMRNETHLGIKALASSAVSGHKLAKHASSNLWSFFLPSKLQQETHVQKQQALQPFFLKNRVVGALKHTRKVMGNHWLYEN